MNKIELIAELQGVALVIECAGLHESAADFTDESREVVESRSLAALTEAIRVLSIPA